MKQFFKKFLSKFRGGAFLALAAMLFVGSMVAGMKFHSKAGAVAANEGVEYFLKLEGIPGESTDKGHQDEINLTSYAWAKDEPGLKQSGVAAPGGGGGTGKVQLQDFHFTTTVNKSSPKLMAACASGKHLKEAILTARKKGSQQDFLVIKLQDAAISSYRTSSPNGGAPVDEFTVSFARAEFAYTPLKADGSSDGSVVGTVDPRSDGMLQ